MPQIESAVAAGHFAAGFFTYECGSFFEPTAALRTHRPARPATLAWFGIYDRCYRLRPSDRSLHRRRSSRPSPLSRHALPRRAAARRRQQLNADLSLTKSGYARAHRRHPRVDSLRRRLSAQLHCSHAHPRARQPAALYRRLRSRQPAPYCAFLHSQPDRRILSFSPELFFHLENHGSQRRIATRPMKGTAPRGRTTREDRVPGGVAPQRPQEPQRKRDDRRPAAQRSRAACRIFGTVRAEDLFAVERYPTLWQMTSTVTGDLRPEVGFQQIFRALFPCGSVTGAPKVRAMQLLAEIERRPRGVYTGAIGFFSQRADRLQRRHSHA